MVLKNDAGQWAELVAGRRDASRRIKNPDLAKVKNPAANNRPEDELIREIRSGTGIFFSKLVDHFRTNPSRYYVNQICGATVTEWPETDCPICHNPVLTYRETPKP